MTEDNFVIQVLKIASQYNPDLVNSSSYEEVLKDLEEMKTNALKFEIVTSAFKKPEPQLPRIHQCDI